MKVPNAIGSKAAWALVAVTLLTGCSGATPEAILASGKEYLAKNDRPAAVIQLKNALQKSPDLVEARYLLGKTQLEMGEVQAAEKELRRASELKHPPDEVIPPLARAMLFSGEYKKVITEFGKTDLTTAEANADLQTTLGQAHLAQGNREAAGAAFAAALAAKSGYPEALLGQARLKARTREQLPEALAIVETALASAPKLTEAWQFKGDILAAQGQSDPALAAYLNAVQVKPDFVPAHAQIVVLYSQQGKADEAAKQLETMKKVAPRHPNTLYLQALLAYQKKDFAAAREAIQQELRLAPDYVPGLLLAGVIEIELKSYAQAEANLLKVLQRVPDQSLARRALIVNYLRSAQPEKALEAVRPVLETAENDSNMMALAGEVYMQNGDIAEATRYFDKAALLDPKDPSKRTARALSQLAGGETDRPLRELEQVAATDTGIRADLALVAANLRRRDFDRALVAIDALEKKQPESALPHNLRGAALVGKGDEAAARRSFERALTLNASFFPALANL
ncbi:MAG: PEP-CTERM system TPR-repeat protein PrsT, partial [Betaproteobacteria bacterium]|nr:PEP-CTERM system TPR-repeat protein PrsT [Betaproteobacteria bacterium]